VHGIARVLPRSVISPSMVPDFRFGYSRRFDGSLITSGLPRLADFQ
jgi:hypothetical protein